MKGHLFPLALLSLLAACGSNNQSGYIYDKDDSRLKIALADAKRNYPEYFSALSKSGSENYFVGRQVFGRNVECVSFENYSSVVIDVDLPMYCFNKGTDILSAKL